MKKDIKQRMCVSCRIVQNKAAMLRVVKKLDGNFDIDISGKEQGRGAYICKNLECIKKATKKHLFDRSFKTKVDSDIYINLEQLVMKEGDDSTFG